MSVEANKAAVLRLLDQAYTRGNLAVVDELVSPACDCRSLRVGSHPHATPWSETTTDPREEMKEAIRSMHAAFAGFSLTVDAILAEDDRVVVILRLRGIHRGVFRGVAPTGRAVSWSGCAFRRFAGGVIVEDRLMRDAATMYAELGILPTALLALG